MSYAKLIRNWVDLTEDEIEEVVRYGNQLAQRDNGTEFEQPNVDMLSKIRTVAKIKFKGLEKVPVDEVKCFKTKNGDVIGYAITNSGQDKIITGDFLIRDDKEDKGSLYFSNLRSYLCSDGKECEKSNGRGVGRQLINYVINYAKDKFYNSIKLDAADTGSRLLDGKLVNYYRGFGFEANDATMTLPGMTLDLDKGPRAFRYLFEDF